MPGAAKRPKKTASGYRMPEHLNEGTMLKDLMKKEWTLGSSIGMGGFGEIYLIAEGLKEPTKDNAKHVVKIEPKENGPLFVEMHFYIQVGTAEQQRSWSGGQINMPLMRGQGSYKHKDDTYRFIVIDRLGVDLDKDFQNGKRTLSEQTIGTAAVQIIHTLEYIHSKGYTHNDIKAANLLFGLGNQKNNLYLVDFGLCVKYIKPDGHKEYKADPRKAHDGTIEYLSRDAHIGCTSRRSDLENLCYNLYHWYTGTIPWSKVLTDPLKVEAEKKKFMKEVPGNLTALPKSIQKLFQYVNNLEFQEAPDYNACRDFFKAEWKATGGKVIIAPSATKPKTPQRRKNSLEKPVKPAAAKKTKKPAKIVVDSEEDDIEIEEDSQSEDDMFAATPPAKQIKNGTPRTRGSPLRSKGTPKGSKGTPKGSKGTPKGSKGTPIGLKVSPMKSKGRTLIKPVTKYKEAGCQTSPGFVKRTRQSNGDSASARGAKDEDNDDDEIPAEANGVVMKAKVVKEAKPKPAVSTKRKAKASPEKQNRDTGGATTTSSMENLTPAMLEVMRRKKEKEEEKAAKKRKI